MADRSINVSLILAERIIALFDEVGATEAERYYAVNMVTAMIPVSIGAGRDDSTDFGCGEQRS
jgi:hypothetical protein